MAQQGGTQMKKLFHEMFKNDLFELSCPLLFTSTQLDFI